MAKGFKTGGRQKGTPNKRPEGLRAQVSELIAQYAQTDQTGNSIFSQDFLSLEPKERLMIFEKLVSYLIPKPQAIAVSANIDRGETVEERIARLAKIPGIDDD